MAVERDIASVLQNMFSGWWGVKSGTTDTAQIGFFTNGAGHTLEQGQIGGERNTTSSTNNYTVIKQECNVTRVTGVTETLISASPCYVLGVYANNGASASSGYASLRDASATGGASTPKVDVRATGGDCPDLKAVRFENGVTVQGSAAGTDVSVLWRPIV